MNTNKREEEKKFVDNVELQNNNYKIYKKQVAELKETYLDLMDDYNEYHILIINSPSNLEYKEHYENIKTNIETIFSSLSHISIKILDENRSVLENIDKLDELIAEERRLSLELEGTINDTVIHERSSTTLKSDYTKINYQEFYILLSLVFSIIMVVIIGFIINGYYRNTI